MSITINSNVSSLKAQRALTKSSEDRSSAFERLSSGLRINHASDDAASLSIASSLNAGTREFTVALRNIGDAVSALNIAEGGLNTLVDIVTRISELAEQSANGSYSAKQRTALDTEAQALTAEYARVTQTTRFNGINLLNGDSSDTKFQVGLDGSVQSIISTSLSSVGDGGIGGIIPNGTFTKLATISGAGNIQAVQLVDIDKNGTLDVVEADSANNKVRVLLGNGNGTFAAAKTYATSSDPRSLNLVDLNGDGNLDAITGDYGGNGIDILLGNSDGSFKAPSFSFANEVTGVAIADYDGDGKLDIIAAHGNNEVDDGFYVFRGLGDGTLSGPTFSSYQYFYGRFGLAVGDLDGDTRPDVLAASRYVAQLFSVNSNGTLSGGANFSAPGGFSTTALIADFNNDGKNDIAYADISYGLYVGTNNGSGSFAVSGYDSSADVSSAQASDVNGDGFLDIITADFNSGAGTTASVYLGNGNGSFKARTTYVTSTGAQAIAIGSLFGNGGTDFVVGDANGNLDIFQANGALKPFSVSLLTQSSARSALTDASTALNFLSTQLGKIGSQQSRLHSAIQNATSARENYQAAASKLVDVDVAAESARLVSSQVVQQAAAAVLAQANQLPELSLQLLR